MKRLPWVLALILVSTPLLAERICVTGTEAVTFPVGLYFTARRIHKPQAPGGYQLQAVRTHDPRGRRSALFEGAGLRHMIKGFPEYFEALGFANNRDGIRYPNIEDLNLRLRAAAETNPAWRSPVTAVLDESDGGLDHVSFARLWIQRQVPVAWNAHEGDSRASLHFHDMFQHLPGYLWFPEPLYLQTSKRAKALLEVLDRARAEKKRKIASWAEEKLTTLIQEIDSTSAVISLTLSDMAQDPKSTGRGFRINLYQAFKELMLGNDFAGEASELSSKDRALVSSWVPASSEALSSKEVKGVLDELMTKISQNRKQI